MLRYVPTRWYSPTAWKTWGTYVRWRLETFGLFSPRGRWEWQAFRQLLKQVGSYQRWVAVLDRLQTTTYRIIK